MRIESNVRYSIVVPFYNEQENIPPLYMKLTEVMDSIGESYELIFIDDGSAIIPSRCFPTFTSTIAA